MSVADAVIAMDRQPKGRTLRDGLDIPLPWIPAKMQKTWVPRSFYLPPDQLTKNTEPKLVKDNLAPFAVNKPQVARLIAVRGDCLLNNTRPRR